MTERVWPDRVLEIIDDLYPYNYSVTDFDSSRLKELYCCYLPFVQYSYPSGSTHCGWQIPQGWIVERAMITIDGKDYSCIENSPLGCAYLSPSFNGIVDKTELLSHSATREDLPNAIVYDWTRLYRPPLRSRWGLSIPYTILNSFPSGQFHVDISCEFYDSQMSVFSFFLQGQQDHEFLINAHNCHPFQANDDVSGVALGIAFFEWLRMQPQPKYSYRLLICPELYGPIFWLNDSSVKSSKILGSVLLKSLGNDAALQIQSSFDPDSYIHRCSSVAFRNVVGSRCSSHAFRTYYGNDETVFEAPGYNIPSVTFTRYPFPEYHTSLDTPKIISKDAISESMHLLQTLFFVLENNCTAKSVAQGLYCLSSPDYNLYKTAIEPGISDRGKSEYDRKWNLLMNTLPMMLSRGLSMIDISERLDLPFRQVLEYVREWEKKGLVDLQEMVLP